MEVNQAEAVDLSIEDAAALLAQEPEAAAPEQAEEAEPQAEEQGEESVEAETETGEEETTEDDSKEPTGEERREVPGHPDLKVTFEEALLGFSRTSDYTRKTQEAAEKSKAAEAKDQALEAERQAVRAERDRYAQILDRADEALKEQAEITVDMEKVRTGDPQELAKYAMRTEAEKHRAEIAKQQQALAEQRQQERAEARAKAINATLDELSDPVLGLPGWTDGATRTADIDRMEKHLLELGFTAPALMELSAIPAFVRLAHDAVNFRAMKAAKPAPEKKPPPKAIPAGGKPPSGNKDLERARARFEGSGSVEDAAALLMRRKR